MSSHRTRRGFLTAVAGAVTAGVAGCLDTLTGSDAPKPDSEPVVGGTENEGSPFFDHERAPAREYRAFAEDAVSGGVPKDGIPSIDDPTFAGAADGDARMDPGDPVFGVEIDGNARAYPQYILVRHEIVNDELAGYEIAVTYCPLTGTALGFDREGDEFGVSGMLVNSNLIMYDRSSESWWSQVLGSLVRGVEDSPELLGRSLREVRVVWTTWGRWREVHPDTAVLTEDTGEAFSYTADPYGEYNPPAGYYANRDLLFETMERDDSHHPKAVFVGARTGDGNVAVRKDLLREQQLVEATVGGVPYVAAYHHGLDSAWIYRNVDGEDVSVAGEAYRGPDGERYAADELPLESVNAFDAMWFAWHAFYPESVVVS